MPWFHPPSDYCFVVSEVRQVRPCSVADHLQLCGLRRPRHLAIQVIWASDSSSIKWGC